MSSTSAAKKSAKGSGPTWSKVGGGSGQKSAAKPAAKPATKPAAKSGSAGGRASASGSRARAVSRSKAPARRAHSSAPAFEIPVHVRREMLALTILVLAALSLLGLFTWSSGKQGIVGTAGEVLAQLFGVVAWLVPVSLVIAGAVLLLGQRSGPRWTSLALPVGLGLMLLSLMGFLHLFTSGQPAAEAGQGGGYLGLAVSTLLSGYLTKPGAGVVLLALALAGFILAFGVSLGQIVRGVGRPVVAVGRFSGEALGEASTEISRLLAERRDRPARQHQPVRINGRLVSEDTAALVVADAPSEQATVVDQRKRDIPDAGNLPAHAAPTELVTVLGEGVGGKAAVEASKPKPEPVINVTKQKAGAPGADVEAPQSMVSPLGYIWNLPPLNLLEMQGVAKVSEADLKTKIRVIEEALQSFKIDATVREVNTGPAVTQFAIEPGVGVRVNRITALDKDLALALAAPDIRIEAPIPGQSRIGIEVPNVSLQVVGLRDIIEADQFRNSKGRLKIALGRDTHGQPVVTDLTKLPHILVAGATGSGKSVFLNSMVIGFLLQFTPDDLRMLMIDPKRVELTGFNGIPHLLRPVVTDVRMEKDPQVKPRDKAGTQNDRERPLTAVEALKWALWEMERRYKHFAKGHRGKDGVTKVFRNIEQYRTFMKENPDMGMEHLPYIVIMIDELADLMLTAPEEVETSLCRLAQLARATGIHLVVATQRPSVDVVTGLIKANFPARAAFAVTSQVDSKVILDGGGAEKLLGKGDMLYTASDESKPVRIQGTFVSDAEADKVVQYWRNQLPSAEELADNGVEAPVQAMPMPDWLGKGDANEESEMLEQAIDLVKRTSYVSVSMLQRKLRIGYNRAARLVEQMEELGLISPANGDNRGKPREVLLGAPDNRGDHHGMEEVDLEE